MTKYDPWKTFLSKRKEDRLTLTFAHLSDMALLPNAALTYAWWWKNEDVGTTTKIQCRSWQEAGFDARVDIASKTVTFVRKRKV